MVKQGILITPVLGEVLTNLAPLRMKHSASVPAYHKGKPTWLSLYLFACALTHRPLLTQCKGNYFFSSTRITPGFGFSFTAPTTGCGTYIS